MNGSFPTTSFSRRRLIEALTTAAAIGPATFLAGCKPGSGQDEVRAPAQLLSKQQLAASRANDLPDLNKHRAFMVVWLLVTANQSILNPSTNVPYVAIANALGQHLSETDISTIVSQARANTGYFPLIANTFKSIDPNNPVSTADSSNFVSLVTNLVSLNASLDKHRALLTTWLLVTTNPDWVDEHCGVDYKGISGVLGNQVSDTEVRNIFNVAKSNSAQFNGVAAQFNGSTLKDISGYGIGFYCCRDCPTQMSQVVKDLMNPKVTGTFKEPSGCPSKQLLMK